MGWERKRGKLHELNRLLRGATDTTFVAHGGGPLPIVPAGVRYVITLDADTRLPRGTAKRLVGKMAHALNGPRFDAPTAGAWSKVTACFSRESRPRCRRVARGRSSSACFPARAVSTRTRSRFPTCTRICSAKVRTAERESTTSIFSKLRCAAAFPTMQCSSHDLFEGIFARAGLVSDIELVEEFPSRYDVAAARQHRWARGDWQLLPWILGRGHRASCAPGAGASAERDPGSIPESIPMIGRWKMIDNLRRTLSAPAAYPCIDRGMDACACRRREYGRASFWRPWRCPRCCRFSPGWCRGGAAFPSAAMRAR